MNKSPHAELIDFHPDGFNLIYNWWWKIKFGRTLEESNKLSSSFRQHFVLQLLKEDWCPLLEFPTYTFYMKLPRTLHAQMRVHRHTSSFSQSHQLYEPKNFADDEEYFHIPNLDAESARSEITAMMCAQEKYRELLDTGMLPSLARGVLPAHINLGLVISFNMRTLFQLVVRRRCHILQGTYWNPLLDQMCEQLTSLVDPFFAEFFKLQPCDITGRCLSTIEQNLRRGGQDPHKACPRFLQLEKTNGESACCGEGCEGCLKHAADNNTKVEREIKSCRDQE